MTRKASKKPHETVARLYAIAADAGDRTPAQIAARLNISIQRLTNWATRGISKEGANDAARIYNCDPLTILDGPSNGSHDAKPIFTKERRASDDVVALRVGMECLVAALLHRVPGSAKAFLDDVQRIAKESDFSPERGLLGGLVEIAHGAQTAEEAATQVLRRAGSARRTKHGK